MKYLILVLVIIFLLLIVGIVVMSFIIKSLSGKLKKMEKLLKDSLTLNRKYSTSLENVFSIIDETGEKKKELYETENKAIISRANNLFN